MIYDSIRNICLYKGIHPALDAAIEQLLETDLLAYEVGRHVWNEDTYVNVQSVDYLEFGRWEKHDHYADIQISLNGGESVAAMPENQVEGWLEYDSGRDVTFSDSRQMGVRVPLDEGMFALLFPWDAHMPCLSNGAAHGRRAVVKVKMR